MILVHLQDVTCSIFIDSSGELLYKRGLKTHGGRAPLRETVAASMLRLCDFRPHDAVLDPMCGSGTFALEAAMRAADIAPGWFRTFAFESWPAFRPATWQYIRRQADWDTNILAGLKVYAFDKDQRIVDRLQQTLSKSPLGPAIKVRQADFFTLTPRRISPRPGVALINPPYGKRLRDKSSSRSFYQRLGQKMAADFNGWRLGLVVPEKGLLGTLPFSGALHSFRHGGDRRWILVVRL